MIDSYISPSFPFSLIYLIQNYLVVYVISYISYKKNFINKKIFILLVILSFAPLILNNSLVSWTIFPDQSKYLFYSRQFRLLNLENFDLFQIYNSLFNNNKLPRHIVKLMGEYVMVKK